MAAIPDNDDVDTSVRDNDPALPPRDYGKGAWCFLAGCFWVEGFTWGFPFSYGVFQKYYSTHEPFVSRSGTAAVGTICLGFIYYGAVIMTVVLQKWPGLRRSTSFLGLVIILIALVAGSFAQKVAHLAVTQGMLYGMGGALMYSPFVFYLDEWFDKRKGLAYGFLWAGTGVGGTVVPLVFEWGLDKYGFRIMLRAWALLLAVVLFPLIYFVRPRLPGTAKSDTRPLHLGFLKSTVFWILQGGNTLQGLGLFIPSIYLPTYAVSTGLSPVAATGLVSLLNCTQTVGTALFGSLVDRIQMTTLMPICSLMAAISVFLLWGFAESSNLLWIFAPVYGLFAGAYTAMFTGCNREVQKHAPLAETGILMGTWAAGRGVGAGTSYGILIIFVGVTAVLGGLGLAVRFIIPSTKGRRSDQNAMVDRSEGVSAQ